MDSRSDNGRQCPPGHRGLAWVALALGLALPAATLEPTLVSIGTGGRTGAYYLAGGAICELADDRRWETGVRCLAETSDGSIQNLREVRSGARTFGIVQSDWQYHAVKGTSAFSQAGPDHELRSVFSLFLEPFTVVARPDAGIRAFGDLKGKRVSLGPTGSGGRATMSVVMQALGWTDADFGWVTDLAMPDVPRALCNGEIDAAVFVVAHPNLTVEDVISTCNAVLVPVAGPEIEQLMGDEPLLHADGDPVRNLRRPGDRRADLRADCDTGRLVAHLACGGLRADQGGLRRTSTHSARPTRPSADLDKIEMFSEGLTAPLHQGALRYFDEAKLR